MHELLMPYVRRDAQSGDECFIVQGRRVGAGVEVEVVHYRCHRHLLREETLERISAFGLERFKAMDATGWTDYCGQLEAVAGYAAQGEFGYFVLVNLAGDHVDVELVHREFTDGRVVTEIEDRKTFSNPETQEALVASNEYAVTLRAKASALNEKAAAARHEAYGRRRQDFERADAHAREAAELANIVNAEGSNDTPTEL